MTDTPHRLTGLDVDEVSLVDRPAINRKFLVVKRDASGNLPAAEPAANVDTVVTPTPTAKKEESAMPDGDKTYTQAEIDKMIGDATAKAKAEGRADAEKSNADTVAKALESAGARVTALEKDARVRSFRDHVITKRWTGDPDKNAALCEEMSSALKPETFKAWLADKDATAKQLEESGIFKELGTSAESEGGATDTLMKKVATVKSDIKKSGQKLEPGAEFDRIAAVLEEDPDLYNRSREEHMTKVRLAGLRGLTPSVR